MDRKTLSDLVAFAAVAQERSFTRAAARLGLSQSGLSHLVNGLERRLGLRLLARTTRTVATTAAGARLLAKLETRLAEGKAPSGLATKSVYIRPLMDKELMPNAGSDEFSRTRPGNRVFQPVIAPKQLPIDDKGW